MSDDVETMLETLRADFNGLLSQHRSAMDRIAELEERVDELEAENERLRDTSDLFESIRKSGATTTEDRVVVLVETLRARAAVRDPPRYELDAEGITNVLQGSIKRPNAYPLMDDVVDMVDRSNVLWKQTESRSSAKNTRLVLDLRKGDVPSTIAGQTITGVDSA